MAKSRTFACDFETSVYEGQTNTEVWAAACAEEEAEDIALLPDIEKIREVISKRKG